jgi:hypothetical protein
MTTAFSEVAENGKSYTQLTRMTTDLREITSS